jgi:predicted helicase
VAFTFDEIIKKYRENSTSERDKGDKFERLIKAYLETKPVYKAVLSDVWLWADFPYKKEFGTGGKDTGIDIVCRTHEGDYWAVQCKCYLPDAKVDLETVIFNGLNLRGIYGRKVWDTWYKMSTMLQAGLDISEIITHRYDVKDFAKGFEDMISGQSGKVILDWAHVND